MLPDVFMMLEARVLLLDSVSRIIPIPDDPSVKIVLLDTLLKLTPPVKYIA